MFAGLGAAPRKMSTLEIVDFFKRHADAKKKAGLFEKQVRDYGFYDAQDASPRAIAWAIPARGLSWNDSAYGTVIIFPGDDGILRYTADAGDSIGKEIDKPDYASPLGPSMFDDFLDAGKKASDAAEKFADLIPWVLAGLLLVAGAQFIPRR